MLVKQTSGTQRLEEQAILISNPYVVIVRSPNEISLNQAKKHRNAHVQTLG